MSCKPHCACKCGHSGCECWDGVLITKRDEAELLLVAQIEEEDR